MSKKASPATIGAFVIGAVLLVVAGVLVFGTSKFLVEKRPFVLYFESSIKGLNVGAPVSFRGVRIGTVTDIKAVLNAEDNTFKTPVYADVELDRITIVGGPPPKGLVRRLIDTVIGVRMEAVDAKAQELIERGLRATLQYQSLVTGQLYVDMEFHPDMPIRLVALDPGVQEFPTIQSGLAALQKKLEEHRALEGEV